MGIENQAARQLFDKEEKPDAGSENQPREPRVIVEEVGDVSVFLADIEAVKDRLATPVQREANGRILNYRVIDGTKIKESLPNIWALKDNLLEYAESLWGDKLVPLHDQAAVNINIVPVNGEQGLHYDRNEVTLIMYLTTPNGGGIKMIEADEQTKVIKAQAGRMVALVGADKILHTVEAVREPEQGEDKERIAIVVGYGLPGHNYVNPNRDDFLYRSCEEQPVPEQEVF